MVVRGKGLGEALAVAREAPEARGPRETPLEALASRQQDETPFGLGVFDHLEADPVGGGRVGGVGARIRLVHVAERDALAGDGLHRRV